MLGGGGWTQGKGSGNRKEKEEKKTGPRAEPKRSQAFMPLIDQFGLDKHFIVEQKARVVARYLYRMKGNIGAGTGTGLAIFELTACITTLQLLTSCNCLIDRPLPSPFVVLIMVPSSQANRVKIYRQPAPPLRNGRTYIT